MREMYDSGTDLAVPSGFVYRFVATGTVEEKSKLEVSERMSLAGLTRTREQSSNVSLTSKTCLLALSIQWRTSSVITPATTCGNCSSSMSPCARSVTVTGRDLTTY